MPSLFSRLSGAVRNIIESISGEGPDGDVPLQERIDEIFDQTEDIIMSLIVAKQPIGEQEEAVKFYDKHGNVTFERDATFPSVRMGHTPIEEGWYVERDREGNKFRMRFANESEHIFYVIGGKKAYNPSWSPEGPLVFWWGSPQKWIPAPPAHTGSHIFPYVNRKPPILNDFIDRVIDESADDFSGKAKRGINRYLIETIEKHRGFRRV